MDIPCPVHMAWFSDSETFNRYLTGDNQHDLKQGNQTSSLKHQLLQSHRNSTNVLREQTLNLATARKRLRESQNNFYRGVRPSKNSPEVLFCQHTWSFTYPRSFPSHCQCFPGSSRSQGSSVCPPSPLRARLRTGPASRWVPSLRGAASQPGVTLWFTRPSSLPACLCSYHCCYK